MAGAFEKQLMDTLRNNKEHFKMYLRLLFRLFASCKNRVPRPSVSKVRMASYKVASFVQRHVLLCIVMLSRGLSYLSAIAESVITGATGLTLQESVHTMLIESYVCVGSVSKR